jgi:hypothetical protein
VYSTRAAADLMEVGADKKRWTTWTEYLGLHNKIVLVTND